MPEPRLSDVLKSADEVMACPPEELAWIVLEYSKARADVKGFISKSALTQLDPYKEYGHRDVEVAQVFIEGWAFLENHGLVVQRAGYNSGMPDFNLYRVSRQGQRIDTKEKWEQYLRAVRLPEALLHKSLLQAAYGAYLRGQFDAAVRDALVFLEDSMRTIGKRPNGETGVDMARALFSKPGAALRDPAILPGEADAVGHLFAGAFGYWRNSVGHRIVNLSAEEAGQLLIAASNLLTMFERHHSAAVAAGRI